MDSSSRKICIIGESNVTSPARFGDHRYDRDMWRVSRVWRSVIRGIVTHPGGLYLLFSPVYRWVESAEWAPIPYQPLTRSLIAEVEIVSVTFPLRDKVLYLKAALSASFGTSRPPGNLNVARSNSRKLACKSGFPGAKSPPWQFKHSCGRNFWPSTVKVNGSRHGRSSVGPIVNEETNDRE